MSGTSGRPSLLARAGTRAALALAALAACVRVDLAPNGVASARLDDVAPSVVVGDTLRDSLGNAVRLRLVAFDTDGGEITTAQPRYLVAPLGGTSGSAATDVPLTVDSLTGLTVARASFVAPRARLGGRVADRLQVLDTVDVVPRPDAMTVGTSAAAAVRLVYLCSDDRRVASNDATTLPGQIFGTATPALAVRLTGDSAGTRVGVRRYLVRYAVDAGTTIPTGTSPYGDQRPALYVTGAGVDAPRTFDTTGTDGSTGARLRVVPTLLTRTALPDSAEVRVTATALVSGGRGPVPVASPVTFAVRLIRLTPPGSACP